MVTQTDQTINMKQVEQDRIFITKPAMELDRGGPAVAVCDYCERFLGGEGHMHEMVARSKTMGNDRARERSYQKEICALLCPACHHKIHDMTPAMAETIWLRLYTLYDKQLCLARVVSVDEVMKTRLVIEMPR